MIELRPPNPRIDLGLRIAKAIVIFFGLIFASAAFDWILPGYRPVVFGIALAGISWLLSGVSNGQP